MPKHEPFTPKAIGKRIKSKGLQKLKWFCQMCQKQCRDENGFKCHTSSESHQRQLLLFAENPGRYVEGFSGEFLKDFLHLLKTRFGTRRVLANQVYQEYIKNRDHLHMNATRWVTLTGFVNWMGKKGLCNVDHNEKGWFITYIDRDPETIKRQENLAKKAKLEKDYEERMAKIVEDQIERGKKQEKPQVKDEASTSEFKKESEEEKIKFSIFNASKVIKQEKQDQPTQTAGIALELKEKKPVIKMSLKRKSADPQDGMRKKKSALDELIEEEERMKARKNKRDNWITEDIVVKVLTDRLGEKYHLKKGVVTAVENKYVAVVKMLEGGDIIKIDQEYLETVIPQIGFPVKVVNGAYVDCSAELMAVDFDRYSCKIKISSGPFRGRVVDGMPYEDLSKLYQESV